MNRAEVYVDYFKKFYELADERCRKYWGTNRPNGQAAGLESLICFAGQVAISAFLPHQQKRGHILTFNPDAGHPIVVDAGAGASSVILRTYFKNVITCDPDLEYLNQVHVACEAMGLGHGHWVHGLPDGKWDACFYDYGTKERGPMFEKFLDRTEKIMWIDDAHDDDLVKTCTAVCEKRDLNLIRMPGTIDEHGRYGAIVFTTVIKI